MSKPRYWSNNGPDDPKEVSTHRGATARKNLSEYRKLIARRERRRQARAWRRSLS